MKKFWILCALGTLLTGALALCWTVYAIPKLGGSISESIEQYQKYVRTPIFSGFLTMGSFLLAMKTNILARLKENYDTEEHKAAYLYENEDLPITRRSRFYSGLEDLSNAIGWNVIFCLITAFLQMTLGFFSNPITFSICTGAAGSCLFLLIYLTCILMSEHRTWFNTIEKKMQKILEDSPPNEEKAQ